MFYTTWPCCLYSLVFKWECPLPSQDNIPDREENYILVNVPHTGLGGSGLYGPLRAKPKQFIFMKKGSSPIVFLAGGFTCVGHFRSTVKIREQKPLIILSICWKRATVPWLCSQVEAVNSQDVKGGVAIIAKMAKVRIMPVTYTGQETWKRLATGRTHWYELWTSISIPDIKRWMERSGRISAVSKEFDRLDAEARSAPQQNRLSWFVC